MNNQIDKFPDKIFVKGHLTPAEKLMFANSEISQLKLEIGKLKSEVDFLTHENAKMKHFGEITKADNIEIKRNKNIIALKYQVNKLIKEVDKFRNENSKLVQKIVSITETK